METIVQCNPQTTRWPALCVDMSGAVRETAGYNVASWTYFARSDTFLLLNPNWKHQAFSIAENERCVSLMFSGWVEATRHSRGYPDWGFSVLFPQLQGKCQGITRQDGARPTLSQIVVFSYLLFVLCRSVYCLCVNVYCTTVTGWQPNCS